MQNDGVFRLKSPEQFKSELVSMKEQMKAGPIYSVEEATDAAQKSRNRSGTKLGIKRNQNAKTHPLNRDLFGSPRDSEQFKKQSLCKQAGLE